MKSQLISIVVTIYNKEQHLRKCLNSIIEQTYSNLEVILIDDGSTDGSREICDEYSSYDNRIIVVHTSNRGVGSARQTGIEQVRGAYFIFVDPDDWIDLQFVEKLYSKALEDNVEMVICDYYKIINGKNKYHYNLVAGCDSENIIKKILHREINGSCCNKFIKSSCLKFPEIRFPIGLNYGEDLYFSCLILKNHIRTSYLNEALYYYNFTTNGKSLSKIVNEDSLKSRFMLINLLESEKIATNVTDLDILKYETLQCLFMLKKFESIYTTYKEIHQSIIEKHYKFNLNRRLEFGTYLAIKGFPLLAFFIYKLSCYISVILYLLGFKSVRI